MKATECDLEPFGFHIEYKKRIRKQGLEYYGRVFEKEVWSFSFIRSRDGKEVFFHPENVAKRLKHALINCIVDNERQKK